MLALNVTPTLEILGDILPVRHVGWLGVVHVIFRSMLYIGVEKFLFLKKTFDYGFMVK
jgi:hypothetical protein